MKFLILTLFLIPLALSAQNVKGLYVDGFSTILGVQEKEDSLLRFAENNGFNYLTLYQMHIVNANTPLTNITSAQVFADFIFKAKTEYGINEIGVASENFNAFNTVYHVYNQQHSNPLEKIDVYNLEFEFWVSSSVESGGVYCTDYLQPNGISCDTSGAFSFFKSTLHKIDSLANLDGVLSEAYFGWFNDGQGTEIVETGVDRILLSAYIPSVNYSAAYQFNYLETRLQRLANSGQNVKILPIYSAEVDFMYNWSVTNPFFQPFIDFQNTINSESAGWADFIITEGIQWFAYTDMPKKNMNLSLEFENENSTIIYPNPSTGKITVSSTEHFEKIVLRNVNGTIINADLESGALDLDLKPGIYFFDLFYSNTYECVKLTIF